VIAPTRLHIRLAGPGDARQLAELAARTFRDAYGAANSPEDLALHLGTHFTAERMGALLEDPACATLVAEVDGIPAGYAQIQSAEPPPLLGTGGVMLRRFYLEQAWIGRGIAQALMQAVRAEAGRRGAGFLWLTVWEQSPRAIAFYRKCGFIEAGTTPFTLGTSVQRDLLMSLRL